MLFRSLVLVLVLIVFPLRSLAGFNPPIHRPLNSGEALTFVLLVLCTSTANGPSLLALLPTFCTLLPLLLRDRLPSTASTARAAPTLVSAHIITCAPPPPLLPLRHSVMDTPRSRGSSRPARLRHRPAPHTNVFDLSPNHSSYDLDAFPDSSSHSPHTPSYNGNYGQHFARGAARSEPTQVHDETWHAGRFILRTRGAALRTCLLPRW